MRINGTSYAKGLGVHADSDVRFAIPSTCTMTADIGVDDEVGDHGSVAFEVWNGTTERLYSSALKTGADPATHISVPLDGVRDLRLVVTQGGDNKHWDHADWADAVLRCTASTSTTAAPTTSTTAAPTTSTTAAPTTTTTAAPTTTTAPPSDPSHSVTWLSDRAVTSSTNGWGPIERDMSNGETGAGDGTTLRINGTSYAKGLGVHADSDVRFAIPSTCTMTADIGVDDEVGDHGSVVFEVWNGTTERLYGSALKTGADPATHISVPLDGVRDLRLVVTQGADNDWWDHADWANAALDCVTSDSSSATASSDSGSATLASTTTTGISGDGVGFAASYIPLWESATDLDEGLRLDAADRRQVDPDRLPLVGRAGERADVLRLVGN